MEKDNIYFEKTYTIKQNDLNEEDYVTITSILDMCQDAAGKHADFLSVGYDDLKDTNYYWVLSKNRVKILKDIVNSDVAYMKTFQSEVGYAGFNRDYYIYNKDKNLCVCADSKWCVLDSKTGRIIPSKDLNISDKVGTPKAFDFKPMRISKLDECNEEIPYKVMYCDLDHNHHMNNTKYIVPILNYLKEKKIDFIEIDYVNQCFLDDELKYLYKKISDKEYIINVVNETKEYLALKSYVKLR